MLQVKSFYLVTITAILIQCCNTPTVRDTIANNKVNDIASPDSAKKLPSGIDKNAQEKTLIIKGILDSSGNVLLSIENPVMYSRKLAHPNPIQKKGRYRALVKYSEGDSLEVHFDGLVAGDSEAGQSRHGFFELQIPVRDDILLIRITEVKPGKIIKEFGRKDLVTR